MNPKNVIAELRIVVVDTEVFDKLQVTTAPKHNEHIVYVDINSSRLKPNSYKALVCYSKYAILDRLS